MAVFENLPWIPDHAQFLRAIMAGGEHGTDIARLRSAANMASAGRPLTNINGMPRFGGGGGYRPQPEPAPVEPKGVHIGGIPGSPMLVDPARENQAPVAKPFSLPGDFSGRQFVSDASGDVIDYVAPPNLSTPFGSASEGRYQLDPRTGQPVQITPPAEKPAVEPRLSTVDTAGMSPDDVALSALLNPPRISGPRSVVQAALSGNKPESVPVKPQPNGTRVRNKVTGETATWVNGQLVPDETEVEPAFDPRAGGLPRGFMHMGQNIE